MGAAAQAPGRREPIVDRRFTDLLDALEADGVWDEARRRDPGLPVRAGASLTGRAALRIYGSQATSRQLDFEARAMRARGEGFYTISSAGHEGNACVAAALRPTDPALLHYRSGAFYFERASQRPGETPVFDTLLGMAASSEEPIAGGRHKVWGSATLCVPPQTSTIASHLPKAVGLAIGIERARRLGVPGRYPEDSIVVCSFGDASLNHATAQSGLQTAGWVASQNLTAPVLFLCEDNGLGISVPTPRGWVRTAMEHRAEVRYFEADGLDLVEAFEVAQQAARYVRTRRRPAFLRLRTVRLLGHAGSDIETTYRSVMEIEAAEERDPLLASARILVEAGVASPGELRQIYEDERARVRACAAEAAGRPRLRDAAQVMEPLAPLDAEAVAREAARYPQDARIERMRALAMAGRPRHMAMLINAGLREMLAKYPEMIVFGEDVGKKGGVYHVTADLQRLAGRARVFDSLLDETAILGLAMGAGMAGLLPCPEIQYLAYIHNALDQLRGEACSLQFFSCAQYSNPMVVRVASLAYQKGFGGHFHNDNSTTALRDIPGLLIGCPSRGDDAVGMLRTLFAAAKVFGRVAAFLEPIALYMRKDLESGDGAWQFGYPEPDAHVPIGRARHYGSDDPLVTGAGRGDAATSAAAESGDADPRDDLALITYGNGVPMSLLAARRLRAQAGVRARVLDLRWLQPLPEQDIIACARGARRVLVVDEGRRSGGVAEPVMALLLERQDEITGGAGALPCARVVGADTYIPLGDAAELCLPSVEQVESAARRLLKLEGAAP